ncbi:MAG: hypothetical protein ACFFAH_17695 [Promethearchaeota archaeon]
MANLDLINEEIEIYNSKMRLLTWLYEELKLHREDKRDLLNENGQKLPLNI